MEQSEFVCKEIDSMAAFAMLQSLQDVYILLHRSPDGDCIGGGYALYHLFRQLGIRSRVCCADPIPEMYRDITEGVIFEDFAPQVYISVDVADRKLFGDLLHDRGLADARRPHEQHRPLPERRDAVAPELVALEIGAQGVADLLLGLFDVHI